MKESTHAATSVVAASSSAPVVTATVGEVDETGVARLEELFARGDGDGGRPAVPDPDTGPQRGFRPAESLGLPDRLFYYYARAAGFTVFAVMAAIGIFLLVRSLPAWHRAGFSFFTTSVWLPDVHRFGIAAVLFDTVVIAVVALLVALPVAFCAAIYISEYAPAQLRRALISLVDLMAAIPSIVYALYGFFFLQPKAIGLERWLADHVGWFPPFHVDGGASNANNLASSTFIAGLVVAFTVMPIVCALMREVFSQAPAGEREAAWALGGHRWGVIRTVVLPYGRAGMIGAAMLGLGRALGETITVYLIISPIFDRNVHILQSGGNSIAALIAIRFGDSSTFGIAALMAAGLVLFALTLAVNTVASAIVSRSRSGATTEI